MKITTPYQNVLPPLSKDEAAALSDSLKRDGQLDKLLATEDGRLLDGHNRYRDLKGKADITFVSGSAGWSDDECFAFVFRCNWRRRNLSPDQKRDLLKQCRRAAKALRESDPKKWTQAKLAVLFGVSQPAVSQWFSNISAYTSKLDAKVKIPAAAKPAIARQVAAGESQAQVAAEFGVTPGRISQIVAAEAKKAEKAAEVAARVAAAEKLDLPQFRLGDFREVAETIPDGSVDLIFTDPPYDRKSLALYSPLAEMAARKLAGGGSLVTYAGQYQIGEVLAAVTPHLRFWWTLAVVHTGQSARMTEYGVVVRWKPLLWFVKGTRGDKHTFADDLVESAMEKDTHEWQQSLVEASYYIGKLCPAGGLVFDPFCGGGTTAVAAQKLGRRFLTCDVEAGALALAKGRAASATL